MTTRPKLNIPLNNMIIIELLFDEPVTGKNQYGNYYLYAVKKTIKNTRISPRLMFTNR
jgi:hypothetical protein